MTTVFIRSEHFARSSALERQGEPLEVVVMLPWTGLGDPRSSPIAVLLFRKYPEPTSEKIEEESHEGGKRLRKPGRISSSPQHSRNSKIEGSRGCHDQPVDEYFGHGDPAGLVAKQWRDA